MEECEDQLWQRWGRISGASSSGKVISSPVRIGRPAEISFCSFSALCPESGLLLSQGSLSFPKAVPGKQLSWVLWGLQDLSQGNPSLCLEAEFCLATNKDFCNSVWLQRNHLLSPGQKYVVKEKVGKSQTEKKKNGQFWWSRTIPHYCYVRVNRRIWQTIWRCCDAATMSSQQQRKVSMYQSKKWSISSCLVFSFWPIFWSVRQDSMMQWRLLGFEIRCRFEPHSDVYWICNLGQITQPPWVFFFIC